ncbi:MAG: ADP-dependent NAD(P)H-hydrate dehydratase, partial [Candidatus Limnocylindrales bacterium]
MAESVDPAARSGGPLEAVTALDDALIAGWLPERPLRGHKGTFGKLLVLAGSLDHLGAALLTSRAAYRAGAGLVVLAVPASLQPLAAGRVPEVVTMGLPETEVAGEVDPEPALDQLLDMDHDAAVLGPGLRPGLTTMELVAAYLDVGGEGVGPACVDAEALNSLASLPAWPSRLKRRCVLTPHLGEFARLQAGAPPLAAAEGADLIADDEARARVGAEAARSWGQVMVLKGARTVIA